MAIFCLLCGKRFQTQTALQQHMEVHAGVRSYICSECNRTFPSHTALKRHLRSHTGRWRHRWDTRSGEQRRLCIRVEDGEIHKSSTRATITVAIYRIQNSPTEGKFHQRFKGKNAALTFISLKLNSRGSLFLDANGASLNFAYFLIRMASKIQNNVSS